MKKGKNVFTLIELMIVIAIIAILAGMLLPVLKTVRETAHQIACVNNVRQLGVALSVYMDNWKEYFPYYTRTTGVTNDDQTDEDAWFGPQKLNIPEKILHGCACAKYPKNSGRLCVTSNYGMNAFSFGAKRTDILCPNDIITFGDSSNLEDYNTWCIQWSGTNIANLMGYRFGTPASNTFPRFRHGDRTEYAYFDGSKLTKERQSKSRCAFTLLDGHSEMLSPYFTYVKSPDSDWTLYKEGKARFWKHFPNLVN